MYEMLRGAYNWKHGWKSFCWASPHDEPTHGRGVGPTPWLLFVDRKTSLGLGAAEASVCIPHCRHKGGIEALGWKQCVRETTRWLIRSHGPSSLAGSWETMTLLSEGAGGRGCQGRATQTLAMQFDVTKSCERPCGGQRPAADRGRRMTSETTQSFIFGRLRHISFLRLVQNWREKRGRNGLENRQVGPCETMGTCCSRDPAGEAGHEVVAIKHHAVWPRMAKVVAARGGHEFSTWDLTCGSR